MTDNIINALAREDVIWSKELPPTLKVLTQKKICEIRILDHFNTHVDVSRQLAEAAMIYHFASRAGVNFYDDIVNSGVDECFDSDWVEWETGFRESKKEGCIEDAVVYCVEGSAKGGHILKRESSEWR